MIVVSGATLTEAKDLGLYCLIRCRDFDSGTATTWFKTYNVVLLHDKIKSDNALSCKINTLLLSQRRVQKSMQLQLRNVTIQKSRGNLDLDLDLIMIHPIHQFCLYPENSDKI